MEMDDDYILHVEFCRSCHTHSWCTHHNQSKYRLTFERCIQFYKVVARQITELFPQVRVIGNALPENFIPIKPTQNKYYDAIKNKHVNFPATGAFEVKYKGYSLFSKKLTNLWPDIDEVVNDFTIKHKGQSSEYGKLLEMRRCSGDNLTQKESSGQENAFLDALDKRKTLYRQKHNNFTLTDHFKFYKKGKDQQNHTRLSPLSKHQSQKNTERHSTRGKGPKRSLNKIQYQHEDIPQFLRKKGYMREDSGKKEMLIKLDSISQESIPNIQQYQKLTNNVQNDNLLMEQWNEELNQLQRKFKKFEQKVERIQKKNNQYEEQNPRLEDSILEIIKNRKIRYSKLRKDELVVLKSERGVNDSILGEIGRHPQANKKIQRIQRYLQGSEEQKNQKLKLIYGQWKVLKKQHFAGKNKLGRKQRLAGSNSDENEEDSDQENTTVLPKMSVQDPPNNNKHIKSQQDFSKPQHKLKNSSSTIRYYKQKGAVVQKHLTKPDQQGLEGSSQFINNRTTSQFGRKSNKQGFLNNFKLNEGFKRRLFQQESDNPCTSDEPSLSNSHSFHKSNNLKPIRKPNKPNNIQQTKIVKQQKDRTDTDGTPLKVSLKKKNNFLSQHKPQEEPEQEDINKQIRSCNKSSHFQKRSSKHDTVRQYPIRQRISKKVSAQNQYENSVNSYGKSKLQGKSKCARKSSLDKERNFDKLNQSNQVRTKRHVEKQVSIIRSKLSHLNGLPQRKESQQNSENITFSHNRKSNKKVSNESSKVLKEVQKKSLRLEKRFQHSGTQNMIHQNSSQQMNNHFRPTGNQNNQSQLDIVRNYSPDESQKNELQSPKTLKVLNKHQYHTSEDSNQEKGRKRGKQRNAKGSLELANSLGFKNIRGIQNHRKRQNEKMIAQHKKSTEIDFKHFQTQQKGSEYDMQANMEQQNQSYHRSQRKCSDINSGFPNNQHQRENLHGSNQGQTKSGKKQNDLKKPFICHQNSSQYQRKQPNKTKKQKMTVKALSDAEHIVEQKELSQAVSDLNLGIQNSKPFNNLPSQKITPIFGKEKPEPQKANVNGTEKHAESRRGQEKITQDSQRTPLSRQSRRKKQQTSFIINQDEKNQKNVLIADQLEQEDRQYGETQYQNYLFQNDDQIELQSNQQGHSMKQKKTKPNKSLKDNGMNPKQSLLNQKGTKHQKQWKKNISNKEQFKTYKKKQSSLARHQVIKEKQYSQNKPPVYAEKISHSTKKKQSSQLLGQQHSSQCNDFASNYSDRIEDMSSQGFCKKSSQHQSEKENLSKPTEGQVLQGKLFEAPKIVQENKRDEIVNVQQHKKTEILVEGVDQNTAERLKRMTLQQKSLQFQSGKQNVQKLVPQEQKKLQQKQQTQSLQQSNRESQHNSTENSQIELQRKNQNHDKDSQKNICRQSKQQEKQQQLINRENDNEQKSKSQIQIPNVISIGSISSLSEKINRQQIKPHYSEDDNKETSFHLGDIFPESIQKKGSQTHIQDEKNVVKLEKTKMKKSKRLISEERVVNNYGLKHDKCNTHFETQPLNHQAITPKDKITNQNNNQKTAIQQLNQLDQQNTQKSELNPSKDKIQTLEPKEKIRSKKKSMENRVYAQAVKRKPRELEDSNKVELVSRGVQKDEIQQKSIQTENIQVIEDHSQQKQSIYKDQSSPPLKISEKDSILRHKQLQSSHAEQNYQKEEEPHTKESVEPEKDIDYNLGLQRAKILKQIYGPSVIQARQAYPKAYQQAKKSNSNLKIDMPIDSLTRNCQWTPLSEIYQKQILFDKKSILSSDVGFNQINMEPFRSILKILGGRNELLITRLFQNIREVQGGIYGVWLCEKYAWKCVLVNELIPTDARKNLIFSRHSCGQLWPIILEKAMARLVGGYEKLAGLTINDLFHMLTGSNWINFRIKQDWGKNQKFIKFLTENQKKKFIIYVQKHSNSLEEDENREKDIPIYFVISQKVVNDEEVILQIRQDNKEPFWIKSQLFAAQFYSASVLQLRLNHNFISLELPVANTGNNLIVIELQFPQNLFGSITLSNPHKQGSLRVCLYREQDTNVLRLIGQAKQKCKTKLFFDCMFLQGKYFIFAESQMKGSRLSYFGEGIPEIRVKEEINIEGLKNNITEYLPIDSLPQKQSYESLPRIINTDNSNVNFRQTQNSLQSFKSTGNNKVLRLREQFIDYLMNTKN